MSGEALVGELSAAGHDVDWWESHDGGWRAAVRTGHDLVVAAGGDGTVRKVFTELAGTSMTAAILPLGTANNVARTLRLSTDDPLGAARRWESGRTVRFDVPSVITVGDGRQMIEGIAVGVFATLLAEVDRRRPEATSSSQLWSVFLELLDERRSAEWTIDLDEETVTGDFIGVHVMNIPYSGPVVPIAPAADPVDGLVDVVVIGPEHVDALRRYAEARRQRRTAELPDLPTRRSRHVRLAGPDNAAVAVDDKVADDALAHGIAVAADFAKVWVRLPA